MLLVASPHIMILRRLPPTPWGTVGRVPIMLDPPKFQSNSISVAKTDQNIIYLQQIIKPYWWLCLQIILSQKFIWCSEVHLGVNYLESGDIQRVFGWKVRSQQIIKPYWWLCLQIILSQKFIWCSEVHLGVNYLESGDIQRVFGLKVRSQQIIKPYWWLSLQIILFQKFICCSEGHLGVNNLESGSIQSVCLSSLFCPSDFNLCLELGFLPNSQGSLHDLHRGHIMNISLLGGHLNKYPCWVQIRNAPGVLAANGLFLKWNSLKFTGCPPWTL